METFRKLPDNMFFKLFLGILLFTFIFFGVADFVFGSGKYNVAKVGHKNISIRKFYDVLNKKRNFLINQNPENLDSDYINSKEFKLETLDGEINLMLLEQATEGLHLIPKDSVVIEQILSNPSFAGVKGRFSKQKFNFLLNNLGFTEKEYIEYFKDVLTRRMLISAIANVNMISDSLAEQIYKSRNEKRKVDIITITGKSLNDKIEQPSDEKAREFYNTNTKLFYRPEYRRVSYLEIDPVKLFQDEKLGLTNDEVKKEYEARIGEYVKPETRSIYFIKTDTEKRINEAKKELDNGKNFLEVAQKITGLSKDNLKVENISRNNFDTELSNQIFNTSNNKYSDILSRNGDFIIIYVYKITPAKQLTFEEAEKDVRVHLLAQKREELFSDYLAKIEDKLLLANNINEFAKDLNLKVLATEKFDSKGLDSDGQQIAGIPNIKNFISTVFDLNEKTFSDLIFENNKYYVLYLDKINGEGVLAYSDCKDKARDMLIEKEKDERIEKIANDVEKQLRSTQNTFMVAVRNNLELETDVAIDRNSTGYSKNFLNAVFTADSKNYITNFYKESNGIYKIAVLKQVLKAGDISKENIEMVKKNLNDTINEDITVKYLEYLRKKMGVSINSQALQQLE